MKKFLKITAIVIFVILFLLFFLPYAFRGKIIKIAKAQINSSLNAKADFEKLSVSLFRSFPNVSLGVKNLYIAGINEFEGDTLFSVRSFEVVIDLVSAIQMKDIKIKRIFAVDPRVNARILPDGRANWDIVKDTGTSEDTTTSELNPKINLKQFEISNAFIRYDDDESKIYTTLKKVDFKMTGDLSKDFTTLSINSTTGLLNVVYEGIRYLKDASLTTNMHVDADLKKWIFTLKDNSFNLNDLVLKLAGTVSLPNDNDMVFDLKYGLDKTDFKSLLSLIPAIYMKDFQNVKTSGLLKLNGTVNGTYNDKVMPSITLVLQVDNAMFKYPDLPASADHIVIDMNLFFDGVQNDNSTVDVNRFHVELAGNPVDMTLNIKTPVSDMHVNGSLNMDLNLAKINDVIPLDSTKLTGEIKAGLDFMGYLSSIEKEEYEKFKADGNVLIRDFSYSSPDLPRDLRIQQSSLTFSPRYLDVKSFDAIMGKSDFHVSGKLEDFIPYFFKNKTIRGNFIFTSGVLDLNEFMTDNSAESTKKDTLPLSLIAVPGNIDFKLVSRIDKMYYDKLQIENTIGTILVKDSRVILDGLKMNMLNGSMQVSGEYNTKDTKNPMVDFDFKASTIDIPAAFDAFTTLQQFAPIAQKAVGKVSLGMKYSSYLDEHMMPRMKSIVGRGNFTSDQIGIKNASVFDKIGNALNTKAFSNLVLNNLGVNFEIRDGRLMVNPFETKIGKTTMLFGGDQGLDQTMNYTIGFSIPRAELGSAANAPIDNLISKATSAGLKVDQLENLNIRVKVGGTFKDPRIQLEMKENSKQAKEEIKAQVVQAVQEQIDQKKEEAKAAAQAEVDKIMAEAQKQAEIIRQKAAAAADIVRNEANSNAENLIKKSKDPISKKLAEEAAKRVRQEGENGAQKIIKEAETKAQGVLNSAKEQGDKLLAP
jgi:hypothetical protein